MVIRVSWPNTLDGLRVTISEIICSSCSRPLLIFLSLITVWGIDTTSYFFPKSIFSMTSIHSLETNFGFSIAFNTCNGQ